MNFIYLFGMKKKMKQKKNWKTFTDHELNFTSLPFFLFFFFYFFLFLFLFFFILYMFSKSRFSFNNVLQTSSIISLIMIFYFILILRIIQRSKLCNDKCCTLVFDQVTYIAVNNHNVILYGFLNRSTCSPLPLTINQLINSFYTNYFHSTQKTLNYFILNIIMISWTFNLHTKLHWAYQLQYILREQLEFYYKQMSTQHTSNKRSYYLIIIGVKKMWINYIIIIIN